MESPGPAPAKVEIFEGPTPLGNWQVVAVLNGKFYASSSCRMKSSAKNHVKQDLKDGGHTYPATSYRYDLLKEMHPNAISSK